MGRTGHRALQGSTSDEERRWNQRFIHHSIFMLYQTFGNKAEIRRFLRDDGRGCGCAYFSPTNEDRVYKKGKE